MTQKKKINRVLIVGGWQSTCGNCGQGANPQDKRHYKCYGYGKQPKGCGVKWTHITSSYVGLNMRERTLRMRPDLEWSYEVQVA